VLYIGTVSVTGQGIGRPRDISIDGAILVAARDLLSEVGYAQVTMDATAARAGTSKAAIYRRYKSKAELMFAAGVHDAQAKPPADTGSLRGDLFSLAKRIRSDMSAPTAREVAPHVIAEVGQSPDVSERLRAVFVATERREIEEILSRAVRRGDLRTMPNVATVHRMLGGALFFTIMVIDEPIENPELARVVDALVAGVHALAGAA